MTNEAEAILGEEGKYASRGQQAPGPGKGQVPGGNVHAALCEICVKCCGCPVSQCRGMSDDGCSLIENFISSDGAGEKRVNDPSDPLWSPPAYGMGVSLVDLLELSDSVTLWSEK